MGCLEDLLAFPTLLKFIVNQFHADSHNILRTMS